MRSERHLVSMTIDDDVFALTSSPLAVLAREAGDKDIRTRLRQFIAWQQAHGPWFQPDLAAYRDHLLARGLSARSAASYLSTIRAAYQRILQRDDITTVLIPHTTTAISVEAIFEGIRRAIRPEHSFVDQTGEIEQPNIRLTVAQVQGLLALPGRDSLQGKRDTAILALLACMGIREDELCTIIVSDLYCETLGTLALRIRLGSRSKERIMPYGKLHWCLSLVETWLDAADISEGPVFRGFYPRGGIRRTPLTTRSVRYIVKQYPIVASDGSVSNVCPEDLRRTASWLKLSNGMCADAIVDHLDLPLVHNLY